ncbi:hypothetical protein BH09VER1_BH09VER1_13690 [soil metagenome]
MLKELVAYNRIGCHAAPTKGGGLLNCKNSQAIPGTRGEN